MDLRLGPDFELVGGLSGGNYYLGSEFELRGASGPVVGPAASSSFTLDVSSGVFALAGANLGMSWSASLSLQTGAYSLTGHIVGIGQEIGSIVLNAVTSSIESLIQSATVQLQSFFGVVDMAEAQAVVTMDETESSVEMSELTATITMTNVTAEIE